MVALKMCKNIKIRVIGGRGEFMRDKDNHFITVCVGDEALTVRQLKMGLAILVLQVCIILFSVKVVFIFVNGLFANDLITNLLRFLLLTLNFFIFNGLEKLFWHIKTQRD